MYVLYRMIIGVLKFLVRVPLDLSIEILSYFRSLVSPNQEDYVFISDLRKLDRFTMSPGDLVMEQHRYEEIVNKSDNMEPEVIIGTVVGYDIQWCKVVVSFFNPSEAKKPTVRRFYESELKVLKSSLNELFLQGKIYQAMQQASLSGDPLEEEDPLKNLFENIKERNDNDDDDSGNNGGGLLH